MQKNVISEKTLIPISLLIVLIGGVFWLSTIYSQGNANAADIREFKTDIKDHLKRIEEKLDSLILGR